MTALAILDIGSWLIAGGLILWACVALHGWWHRPRSIQHSVKRRGERTLPASPPPEDALVAIHACLRGPDDRALLGCIEGLVAAPRSWRAAPVHITTREDAVRWLGRRSALLVRVQDRLGRLGYRLVALPDGTLRVVRAGDAGRA